MKSVNAPAPSNAMNLGHFGRGAGTGFDSYKIGYGNPTGLAEAAGGLYPPAIVDGKVTPDGQGSNQWFYWGLAPLIVKTPDEAGLKHALAEYVLSSKAKQPAGLIVGFFVHGSSNDNIQYLADIGVRDAVKLDGSDSVMLGHGTALEWGDGMSYHKRIWMRWGFAFYPY